jgi:hypothetical protein
LIPKEKDVTAVNVLAFTIALLELSIAVRPKLFPISV